MNAADAMASLLVATGIPGLPFLDVQRAPCCLVDWRLLAAHPELNTIWRQPSRSSPCDRCAGAASLVVNPPPDRSGRTRDASAADVAGDDLAEQIPFLALEFLQLELGDRGEVGGAGVNLDARQQAAELQIPHTGRLLHDVLAREIVAAVLQHVHEALRDGVAVHDRGI